MVRDVVSVLAAGTSAQDRGCVAVRYAEGMQVWQQLTCLFKPEIGIELKPVGTDGPAALLISTKPLQTARQFLVFHGRQTNSGSHQAFRCVAGK